MPLPRRTAGLPPSPPRQPLPASPQLAAWLTAPGSLTQRLRRTGQRLEVVRLAQGSAPLLPGEARDLGARGTPPRAHVREVLLVVDGQPLVWARSVASAGSVNGPWRSLKGLGSRPLAELLFGSLQVGRSPLHARRLTPGSPWQRHLARQCRHAAPDLAAARGVWARWSVFCKGGQRLRVLEAFLPAVAQRRTRVGAARHLVRPSPPVR